MLRILLLTFTLLFLAKPVLAGVDASNADRDDKQRIIELSEAHMWPHQFISEETAKRAVMPSGGHSSSVVTWRQDNAPELASGIGYASYWRELPSLTPGSHEIAFDFATSAFEAFLVPKGNPQRMLRLAIGRLGVDAASEIPFLKRFVLDFQVQEGDQWVLVMNISNFHRTYGGFWTAPKISKIGVLRTQANIKAGLNFAIAGSMLIIMLYNFMLFARRRSDLPAFFLALTCLAILLRLIGIENLFSYFVDNVDSAVFFQWVTRVEYGSMTLASLAFLAFLHHTFTFVRLPKPLYFLLHTFSAILLMTVVFCEPVFFTKWVGYFQANVLIHILCMVYITFTAVRLKEDGARYMLASAFIPLVAGVIDVVQSRSGGASYISHFGGAIFIFLQSQILAKRFAKAFERAEHLTEHLQHEVELQTLQIRNIMDNVPEGLFTIGKSLRIQGHCSKYVNQIFPDATRYKLSDLLVYNTTIERSSLDMAVSVLLTIIGEDAISWEINSEHLFTELETHDHRILTFQWHPILKDGIVEEMLIIVRDTTVLRDLLLRTLHQEQEMVLISALAKAKNYRYCSFIDQAQETLRAIQNIWATNTSSEDQSYIRLILTLLHTLKGNSRQIGFVQLAKDVHGFEQNIVDLRETHGEAGADISVVLDIALTTLAADIELIISLHDRYWGVSDHQKDRLLFAAEDIVLLQNWIDGHPVHTNDVKKLLKNHLSTSFAEGWQELESDLLRIADELGKAQPLLDLQYPEGLWLTPSFQTGLLNALGHILRNSIDHGIEAPRTRIEVGKDRSGRISVHASWTANRLQIRIEDDGRGIDIEALVQMTAAPSELALSEKLSLIFSSGVSTAKELSQLSGRGIGMDAVKHEIERLGGTIRMEARNSYDEGRPPRYVPFRFIVEFPESLFGVTAA